MITRRGFIVTSGSAVSALALVGAGPVAAARAGDVTTITSPARASATAPQGRRHITLSGNKSEDFNTLHATLRDAESEELIFALDAADQVLLEIARTKAPMTYTAVPAEQGLLKFRRISLAGA